MWNAKYLSRIDYRIIFIIIALMCISLITISAYSTDGTPDGLESGFFTPFVKKQIEGYILGFAIFIFFAGFDYNKLREWTWLLYALMIISLIGLFFVDPIARVQRWYRLPLIGMNFQPSEYAKLIVVISLSWFLERRRMQSHSWSTALFGLLIVGIPFILILKQPDLGTALVLFPITLVIFYFGDLNHWVLRFLVLAGSVALLFIALIFLGVISHEDIRPYATKVLKDYQFDRLDPNTHHQKAASTILGELRIVLKL